ncbi:hypothetical protein [uncultured Amnibacterium sp.]|uniref:hypothetical protein n=1 Tax=uncultured Amnibacterium sp. TaxID=1631851 RepID=UPI0035C958F5
MSTGPGDSPAGGPAPSRSNGAPDADEPGPSEPEPEEVEEAFRWNGDEADRRIARPAPRPVPALHVEEEHEPGGSAAGLVAFGVVAGVLLLEAVGWVRAILGPISGTIDAGSGSPAELVSFALNIVVRITAVAAAPVWLGFVLWRIPAGARRVAALAIGALVLIPWPALVHA